jgi:two-component sensor histidine kinase
VASVEDFGSAGDRKIARASLQDRGRGFFRAVQLSNVMISSQDRDLRYLWITNPLAGIGAAQFFGRCDEEVFEKDTWSVIVPAKRAAIESATPQTIEFPYLHEGQTKWFELRIEPTFAIRKKVSGVICAAVDISERKQSEYRMRVVLLELAHRSKNLLAIIQGIANRTAQTSASIEEFGQRFTGRLMSLSRAHDILTDANWRGAALNDLVRSQVLLFAGKKSERISYSGSPVTLKPSAAQHVGLALYELTANALKYGSLSSDAGTVTINWTIDQNGDSEKPRFKLVWTERGGPDVASPVERHFGRVLLEDVVPLSVGGVAALDFVPGGISYRLMIPASELG